MRALCWMGVNDLQVNTVPDPRIVNPHDVVLKVRLTTTCGSDLHLIDGYIPTMREGDVIGHEYMGEIVEVGPEATKFKVGDRVVVPSFLGCGTCWYCKHDLWSLCDNTHPKPELAEPMLGYPPAVEFPRFRGHLTAEREMLGREGMSRDAQDPAVFVGVPPRGGSAAA